MVASFAISGIITLIDELIVTQKELAEASAKAKAEIDELFDAYQSNKQTVSNYAQEYAKLSQGVNQFTGENRELSTEDYERFLELSNQLAEAFPQLSRNYTTNGDAIVQLTGDVDGVVSSLNNLVEVQRELANQEMAEKLPDVFKSYGANVKKYTEDIKEIEDKIAKIPEQLQTLQGNKRFGLYDNSNLELDRALNDLDVDYSTTIDTKGMGYDGTITYNLPSTQEIQDQAKVVENEYKKQIAELENKLAQENQGLQKYFFAFLSTDWDYVNLSTEMQSVVQTVTSNIDWSNTFYNGELVDSWEDAEGYIQTKVVGMLKNTSAETQQAFSDMLSIDRNSISTGEFVDEYNAMVERIIKELNLSDEEALEFRIKFSYVAEDEVMALAKGREKMGIVTTDTMFDKQREEWLKTLDPSDLELLLTLDIDRKTSLANIKRMLAEAKEVTKEYTEIDITSSIEGLDTLQDTYKTLSSAVKEYNEKRFLSLDTVQALLQLDDRYLSTLVSENGQLKLNTQSFNDLTTAKLHQLEVDVIANTMSLISSLKNEGTALVALKQLTVDTTGARWEDVDATLEQIRANLILEEMEGKDVKNRLEALDMIEQSVKTKKKIFESAKDGLLNSTSEFYGATDTNTSKDNVFDWIANSIANANREIDNLNDKLANASINDKVGIYDKLISANKKLATSTKAAADAYEDEWLKQSAKISPEYRDKIMSNETFEIEDFSSQTVYDNVIKSQKAYEDWQTSLQEHSAVLQQQIQLERDKISNNIAINQLKLDTIRVNNQETLTAKEKNKLLKEEHALLYKILQDNLKLAQTDEEKKKLRKDYKQDVDANKEQQRANEVEERDNKISYYDSVVKDIQNEIALQGGQGTEEQYLAMNAAIDREKEIYGLQHDAALEARNAAEWGTAEWTEHNNTLQTVQDNLNALELAQIENNRAILLLPVKKYEDLNKELEEDLKTQTKLQEKIESAIGYATTLVQDEIDALNERKEVVSDSYDDQIKTLQAEKDAFTETNDELQRQIDLENAKFNLEKAINNKTHRIYRKGEGFVYEADQNAVRDAQQNLDQIEYDNIVADYDKQLKDLNDDKEDDLEAIDNEIKSWDEYAKQLNKVSDSYERLISKRNFLSLFGETGESSILNKDLGIITTLENTLNSSKLEIDGIQEKIDANNLTIQKIKEEAESYLGTATQLREAQNAINKAIVENETELAAIQARTDKTGAMAKGWTDADTEIEGALDLIGTAQTEGKKAEDTVLGERKLTLEKFRDAAVLLYKEIAREVSKANLAFSSLETTLTNAQKTYKEILALSTGAGNIETTITYTIPEMRTFHSGGIVGDEISKNKLPDHLIALTEANLKPNETLAKLLNGEVVLNNTQMGNMFSNLGKAYSATTPLNKRENSPVEITIGDVNVYNPENTDMIVNEIVKELPLKVVQRLHSK